MYCKNVFSTTSTLENYRYNIILSFDRLDLSRYIGYSLGGGLDHINIFAGVSISGFRNGWNFPFPEPSDVFAACIEGRITYILCIWV